jgi:phosphoglycolate phosphatase
MSLESQSSTSPLAFDAVLIDLDGTLMDTIPDLANAANTMRHELGLSSLPQAQIATFIGKGAKNLVMRMLTVDADPASISPELFERARASYFRNLHQINGDQSVMFDGVIPGLELMKSMGLRLAVVTNKATEFTLPLLERTGLAPYFQAVVCGDTLEHAKPHPAPMLHACNLLKSAPARSVAIGDSINDAQSARAAGCSVLAVPYGYNEGQSVQTLDVDAIVDSIEAAAHWVAAR